MTVSRRETRTWYVYQLCREKALKGDAHLMMLRSPEFHGSALADGSLRELQRRARKPAPSSPKIIVSKPVLQRPGARGRRK